MQKCCLVGCDNGAIKGKSDYCNKHYQQKREKQESRRVNKMSIHDRVKRQIEQNEACEVMDFTANNKLLRDISRRLAIEEELRLSAEAVVESVIIVERKACYEIAQNALCHARLDLTTIDYIAGNIKARGLEI